MARKDQPYLPLYVQDFLLDEKLVECSAEAHGVYIRLMCLMHKSATYGAILLKQKDKQNDKQNESKVADFAYKLARQMPFETEVIERALSELLEEGVIQLEGDVLYQKRMVRDGKLSDIRALSGKKGGKLSAKECKNENFAIAKPQAKQEAKSKQNTENEIVIVIDNENET